MQDGKLSLETKLSHFYPEIGYASKISISNLLSHTSGLKEYTQTSDIKGGSEKEFIDFAKKYPLDFEPGSSWSYSNTGYFFLGFIISKITGLTYEAAMSQYIFKPLGMKHSGFDFKLLNSPDKTIGYDLYYSDLKKPAMIYDPPGPYAAGAIWSDPMDLLIFHQALQGYKLVNRKLQDSAYQPLKNQYGLGWQVDSFENRKMVKHSGGAAGYRSQFIRIPEDDVCIVVLANAELFIDGITGQILNILYGKPFKVPVHQKVSANLLKHYEGTYQIPNGPFLIAEIDHDVLTVQARGQGTTNLFTEGLNRFYVTEINGYVSFMRGHNKMADTLVLEQNGRTIKCPRIQANWGITGSATANGWEGPDIPFEKQGDTNQWMARKISLKDGEIKFRLLNDWTRNLGTGEKGALVSNGSNMVVKAGVYDIELNLSDSRNPTFKMTPVVAGR